MRSFGSGHYGVCHSFVRFQHFSFLQASTVDTNLNVTNLAISTGSINTNQSLTSPLAFTGAPYVQSTGGWDAVSQTAAKSFEFTITANAGFYFDIETITLNALSANSGPANIGLSFDDSFFNHGIVNDTFVKGLQQNFTNELDGLNSLTIGIQGWGGGVGDFRIDDITVFGTVTPFPNIWTSGDLGTNIINDAGDFTVFPDLVVPSNSLPSQLVVKYGLWNGTEVLVDASINSTILGDFLADKGYISPGPEFATFGVTGLLLDGINDVSFTGNAANLDDYVIGQVDIYYTSVPEPATFALFFGTLALGLALWQRRRPVA